MSIPRFYSAGDGEFIPTSALNGANPEEGRRNRLDALRRLRDSPDGTFLRNIGERHTNGFVKQDGEVYYVDGYSGDRYRIDFGAGANRRDDLAFKVRQDAP